MNQPYPVTQSDALLQFFKASADALRLDILRVLRAESFGVLELCHIFAIPQPAMSHHLKILSTANLVATRREGNSIFYRRSLIPAQEPEAGLFRAMFTAIDAVPVAEDIQARVVEIHADREQNSRIFFEKNANRFKENQDLIADFSHYGGCVTDLLNSEALPPSAQVVEVGPGESPLLATLARSFEQVIAIDSSEEMLERARAHTPEKSIDFRLGELTDIEDQQADLIILNMVLHHVASPAGLFHTASQKLKSGGRLFIMDLCPHSQDWARDVCGDLWLGFEPGDLETWAIEANLAVGQSAYLGLKNGFQVQLKLFHKT